jgi:pSer/pThr/pTyr-binding forkhead associated (FHA) protein
MPTNPDQDDRLDIDLTDVDLTDELPVLIETAVFESDKHVVPVSEDDDGAHTARVMALVSDEVESVDELKKDLEHRAAKIEALERDVERLSGRRLEMERILQDKDTTIGSLKEALETAQSAIKELRGIEDRLTADIAERDNRIARLVDESDHLHKEMAAARTELERLGQEREAERREVAALRAQIERSGRAEQGALGGSEVATRADALQAQATKAAADLETAHKELADTRAQLEHARADATRMEQALVDKDRALAARDERIRTLQLEIEQRPGAVVQINTPDTARDAPDQKTTQRADAAPDSSSTPALVCLTSDGPRRFALVKGTVTIGRSASCDIQILTHFVSREHARLTVSPRGGVVIEDLGSTNGVFVNAVRVHRQELHHGDVVTIGESQFRFLETMAH